MSNGLNSASSVNQILMQLPSEERNHMLRVGKLVGRFAEKLQSYGIVAGDFEECRKFGSAAFYHDIGKAWIPYAILTKPGKLTDEEQMVLRDHPLFAKKLFERVNQNLVTGMPEQLVWLAADSAVYHHERWDGSGYPFGIGCNKIPLIARITSICDAYDAMISDRIYQKGHSRKYAIQELERCAGTQFDPELVKIFLSAGFGTACLSTALSSYP